jgi:hypothetical protein
MPVRMISQEYGGSKEARTGFDGDNHAFSERCHTVKMC